MRKIIPITIISMAVFLFGCTNTMTAEQRTDLQQKKVDSASQPMLTLECSNGCNFDKLELRDPSAVANLPAIRTPTNHWDFANKVLGSATAVAPWFAVTKISADAIGALEDRQDSTRITNTTTEQGDSAGGDIVGGDQRGDTRGDVSGDTRGDVRGDVRGDTVGNDQIGGDNSTSDPTVVDQPEPTVVEQPEPTVVQP